MNPDFGRTASRSLELEMSFCPPTDVARTGEDYAEFPHSDSRAVMDVFGITRQTKAYGGN